MTRPDALEGLALRAPPAAPEAEQALLGAILVNNAVLDRIETLRPDHFADALHAEIFAAILARTGRGQLVSAATLASDLGGSTLLAEAGGTGYLGALVAAHVTLVHARDYAFAISDSWLRRQAIDSLAQTIQALFAPGAEGTALAALDGLETALFALTGGTATMPDPLPAAAAARTAIAAARAARDGLRGVPSGLVALDRVTAGFQPGNLYVVGARPGMGKTALAATIACRAAAAGHAVLFASLEMTAPALAARMAAAQAGLPLSLALQDGRFAQDDMGRWVFTRGDATDARLLEEAIADLGRLNLLIDFAPDLTVARLRSRVRRLRRKGRCDLVIVDYLGLMRASDRARRMNSKVQEVADISRDLKVLAGELDVPVLVLSQLNRESEKRDGGRPYLADLRDSGAIEQDAEVVALLHREYEALRRNEPKRQAKESTAAFVERCSAHDAAVAAARGTAKLFVDKNRQGQQVALDLRWNAESTWFSDPREPDGARFFDPPAEHT